jgi:hypothetical protein
MSYVIPGGLPSLAHPLIGKLALGSRKSKSVICQPPFPEIDLSWDGFTLSHFHLVGIKYANYEPRWQHDLFIRHELAHHILGLSPFSRLRKRYIWAFYAIIEDTFKNGKKRQKTIPVPLRYDLGRNELEKHWKIVVDLHKRSELVEELFAVRSSLLETKVRWDINSDDLQPLIRGYLRGKRSRGKLIENQ